MRRRMSLSLLISTVLVALWGSTTVATAAPVPPATDEIYTCTAGEVISEVLPGNLVVPAGVSCSMTYGAVRGYTTVDGDLTVSHSTLKKTITLNPGASYEARAVTMWGWVVSHQAHMVTMIDVSVVGSIVGSIAADGDEDALLKLVLAKINGSVDVDGAGFAGHYAFLQNNTVLGTLSYSGESIGMKGGTVGGRTTVDATRTVSVCGTTFGSRVIVEGTRDGGSQDSFVAFGGDCGHTVVLGSLVLRDNTTDANTLTDVIVRKHLRCRANDPAPVADTVIVGGKSLGQCRTI